MLTDKFVRVVDDVWAPNVDREPGSVLCVEAPAEVILADVVGSTEDV